MIHGNAGQRLMEVLIPLPFTIILKAFNPYPHTQDTNDRNKKNNHHEQVNRYWKLYLQFKGKAKSK